MPAFGGGGLPGLGGGAGPRFPDFTKKNMPIPAPAAAAPEPAAPAAAPQLGPGQNLIAPKRGRGELKQQAAGGRMPLCGACGGQIRSWPRRGAACVL